MDEEFNDVSEHMDELANLEESLNDEDNDDNAEDWRYY